MPSGVFFKEDVMPIKSFLSITKDGELAQTKGYSEVCSYKDYKVVVLEDPVHGPIKYVELPEGFLTFKNNIGGSVRLIDLLGYAFKKVYLKEHELKHIECLPIDGDFNNITLDNLVWKYPVGGVECIDYPGFMYVPGYTRYALRDKEDGTYDIMFLGYGTLKMQSYTPAGYIGVSMSADGANVNTGIGTHRAAALVFTDYPLNSKDLHVDHIDHKRTNNLRNNFQWLTMLENLQKGKDYAKGRYAIAEPGSDKSLVRIKIKMLDVTTKEIVTWNTLKELLDTTGLIDWQVRQSIIKGEEGAIGLVTGKYLFRYEDQEFPVLTEDDLEAHKRFSGQSSAALLKNTETGEVKEFVSAAQLVRATGLSKKVVTTRLRRGSQVIPGTVYLVKYKDETQEWVK